MNYYIFDVNEIEDKEYCYIEDNPTSLGINDYYLRNGEAFGQGWPEDVTMKMSDRLGGIKLPTQITNTNSFLILHRDAIELIKPVCPEKTEFLPFALLNHKGRVASKEYFIVNPIGTYDCIDYEESEVEYFEDEILDIKYYVFDKKKFSVVPDVFRVKDAPTLYIISETVLDKIRGKGFTNILLDEIDFD